MGLGFLLRLVMSDHDVAPLKKLFPTRNSGLAYLIKFRVCLHLWSKNLRDPRKVIEVFILR